MKTFHELNLEERINVSHQQFERMRRPNGGYIASPYTAEDGSGDAYNVFWIRDIMFATYANEYLGCFDKMVESFRLVLDIFKRYHSRIIQARSSSRMCGIRPASSCRPGCVPPRSTPSPMRGGITSSMFMVCSCIKWAT